MAMGWLATLHSTADGLENVARRGWAWLASLPASSACTVHTHRDLLSMWNARDHAMAARPALLFRPGPATRPQLTPHHTRHPVTDKLRAMFG